MRRGRREGCGCPHAARDRELSDLPDVRRIIDTSRRGEEMPGIGWIDDGILTTYHVTDRPEAVVRFLRRRGALVKAYGEKGRTAELGPGFYTSGNPEFWVGRAGGKWSFLKALDDKKTRKLTHALRQTLLTDRRRGRLTRDELARAVRTTRLVDRGVYYPSVLTEIATLPYAIAFWKPEYLEPLGISPGARPGVVELRVRGRFAQLGQSYPGAGTLRTLRRAGLQGAFTTSGMSTNPEMVVWDPRAIVSAKIDTSTQRDARRRRR